VTTDDDDQVSVAAASVASSVSRRHKRRAPRDLPMFRVVANGIKEVDQFLSVFERKLIVNGLTPDADWSWVLPASLGKEEADWVKDNVPADATWAEMCALFTNQFEDPCKVSRLRIELLDLRRGSREAPAEFCVRAQRLAKAAGIANDSLLATQAMIRNLPK